MKDPNNIKFTENEPSAANLCMQAMQYVNLFSNTHLSFLLFDISRDKTNLEPGPEFTLKTRVKPEFADKKWAKEVPVNAHAFISQVAFKVYFENFREDWLDEEKAKKLLTDFDTSQGTTYLFIVSNFESPDYHQPFEKTATLARNMGICLRALSCQDFVKACQFACYSEESKAAYRDIVKKFEERHLIDSRG